MTQVTRLRASNSSHQRHRASLKSALLTCLVILYSQVFLPRSALAEDVIPPTRFAEFEGAFIFADNGNFIGRFSQNPTEISSIGNELGPHGSAKGADSIFNPQSIYGSTSSNISAFNPNAQFPPLLILNNFAVAFITANQAISPRIDPFELTAWLEICQPQFEDCSVTKLKSSACVGANGFLNQINIASIINLQNQTLRVLVEYIDQAGVVRGSQPAQINPKLKADFIVNDLGLAPDSIGTVCVTTDAPFKGAWTGGVTLYKPDIRSGTLPFGQAFDFALYYPFSNALEEPLNVPINTFRLGTDPNALIANWFSITDATPGDGFGLEGKIVFLADSGNTLKEISVSLPDGGRGDFGAHDVFGPDQVGLARFTAAMPNQGPKPAFYGTLTRYFYDCPGASCTNFLTAFVLPFRPPAGVALFGGASTKNEELSIIELGNLSGVEVKAALDVFTAEGINSGSALVSVPPLGTRHTIVNRVGSSGFLENSAQGAARVQAASGLISAVNLFYKLDAFGKLLYGYAAPMTNTSANAQLSEFNSFIGHLNETEVTNPSAVPQALSIKVLNLDNSELSSLALELPGNASFRLPLQVPKDTYGTIQVQSTSGVVFRNYVSRPDSYVLSYDG